MPTGGVGKVRVRKGTDYSGQGPYPNNVDAMRKASNTLYREVVHDIGLSTNSYLQLVKGQRVLTDALAAKIATIFKCSTADLRWEGQTTTEKREVVPYKAPQVPAPVKRRGRPRKTPVAAPVPRASTAQEREPIEITVARGGRLLGGITMFHARDFKAVLRDIFGDEHGI